MVRLAWQSPLTKAQRASIFIDILEIVYKVRYPFDSILPEAGELCNLEWQATPQNMQGYTAFEETQTGIRKARLRANLSRRATFSLPYLKSQKVSQISKERRLLS
jgi:hypothetical protein